MSTTYEAALQAAEQLLDSQVRPGIDEEVIVDVKQVQETEGFWVFFYNTRVYLETGAVIYALAGNGPVLIDKVDGHGRIGRSDVHWEAQAGIAPNPNPSGSA